MAASGQSEAASEGALTMQSAPETGTQAPLRDLNVSSSDERVEFHPIDMSDETVSAVPAGPEGRILAFPNSSDMFFDLID